MDYNKSPAFAVQTFLIPGFNQVGAMSESLGFPVLPGHAHPFRMIAPYIFYSRGTRCIYHAQSRGTCSFSLVILYTRIHEKWQGEKLERIYGVNKKSLISISCVVSRSVSPSYNEIIPYLSAG